MALKDGIFSGVSMTARECEAATFLALRRTSSTEQYAVDWVARNL